MYHIGFLKPAIAAIVVYKNALARLPHQNDNIRESIIVKIADRMTQRPGILVEQMLCILSLIALSEIG